MQHTGTTPANNIGILRLILASLVIISHASELIDGDRSREPMTMLFHTMSLGDMAVTGFFLISGYLITKSALQSPSATSYLKKRILRIYPAFIVTYLIGTFLLTPLFHTKPEPFGTLILRLLTLSQPPTLSIKSLPYPSLNGAMWTLAYEFRCYIFILILHLLGLLRRKHFVFILMVAGLFLNLANTFPQMPHIFSAHPESSYALVLLGTPHFNIRLLTSFLTGSVIFLFGSKICRTSNTSRSLLYFVLLILCLFSPHTAQFGFDIFGGLLLYFVAFKTDFGPLRNINTSWDISYGTYLWGWPIETCLIYWLHIHTPFILTVAALPIAWGLGAASWLLIEKRFLSLAHGQTVPPQPKIPAAERVTPVKIS